MTARRTVADPNKLLLGNGELFFNGEFVGTLGGSVALTQSPNYAKQRAGDSISPNKAFLTTREVKLVAEVAEFKLENLKFALGSPNSIQTGPFLIKRIEFITLNGTTPVTLAETADESVNAIKVFSTTRGTQYTLTTDYTFATNMVTRVAPGAIADGQVVLVEYDVSVAGSRKLAIGNNCDVPTFQMDFVHKECNTNGFQIVFYKAYADTDFEMSFNTRESGDFTLHNVSFEALADENRLPSQNLWEIISEV